MAAIKAFITRHPVRTYVALTFAISWGGPLGVGGLGGVSGTTWQSDPRLPFLVVMLAGLATGLIVGERGTSLRTTSG
jgi:hypothetical protein